MSFTNFLDALEDDLWDEKPVEIEEFVQSEDFLAQPPLSDYQYQMCKAGSQIFKLETLIDLYGEETGLARHEQTFNEVILQLGKGSGKDHTSTIMCAYIVYLLLCLKDPAGYYGKPKGDNIDILNVAINSDQAKNVFFKGFHNKIKHSPWFAGKYNATANSIEFDKSINVYSGHSERESFEGLNLLVAVLDEISGFALESPSGSETSKTADGIYKMYRASVDSRFAEYGKVLLLSFPRFPDDYIQQRYDAVIAEKEVVIRSHNFKIDADLPNGTEGNEFQISWEEDHIVRYKYPRLYALKRPTWEVNPTVAIDSPAMIRAFAENTSDALGRFACMPSTNVDTTFFKNQAAIDLAFSGTNGVDEYGTFWGKWQPIEGMNYYMHVDLAQVQDNCAVAISHVDRWTRVSMGNDKWEVLPVVKIDAVRWWTPTKQQSINFEDVKSYIVSLKRKGFNIRMCTFDRWHSLDMMNFLTNEQGIPTEVLSVADKHYHDFQSVMYGERLEAPLIPLLIDELKQLRYIKNKIDHPRKSSKDLSDACCGTIFNTVKYELRPSDFGDIEVKSIKMIRQQQMEEERQEHLKRNVIHVPKSDNVPHEISSFFNNLRAL